MCGGGVVSRTCRADHGSLGKAWYQGLRARDLSKTSPVGEGFLVGCSGHTYLDSDWAGDPDTRRSTSGVATDLLGVNLQSHFRAQQTIALSSGEAELYVIGA